MQQDDDDIVGRYNNLLVLFESTCNTTDDALPSLITDCKKNQLYLLALIEKSKCIILPANWPLMLWFWQYNLFKHVANTEQYIDYELLVLMRDHFLRSATALVNVTPFQFKESFQFEESLGELLLNTAIQLVVFNEVKIQARHIQGFTQINKNHANLTGANQDFFNILISHFWNLLRTQLPTKATELQMQFKTSYGLAKEFLENHSEENTFAFTPEATMILSMVLISHIINEHLDENKVDLVLFNSVKQKMGEQIPLIPSKEWLWDLCKLEFHILSYITPGQIETHKILAKLKNTGKDGTPEQINTQTTLEKLQDTCAQNAQHYFNQLTLLLNRYKPADLIQMIEECREIAISSSHLAVMLTGVAITLSKQLLKTSVGEQISSLTSKGLLWNLYKSEIHFLGYITLGETKIHGMLVKSPNTGKYSMVEQIYIQPALVMLQNICKQNAQHYFDQLILLIEQYQPEDLIQMIEYCRQSAIESLNLRAILAGTASMLSEQFHKKIIFGEIDSGLLSKHIVLYSWHSQHLDPQHPDYFTRIKHIHILFFEAELALLIKYLRDDDTDQALSLTQVICATFSITSHHLMISNIDYALESMQQLIFTIHSFLNALVGSQNDRLRYSTNFSDNILRGHLFLNRIESEIKTLHNTFSIKAILNDEQKITLRHHLLSSIQAVLRLLLHIDIICDHLPFGFKKDLLKTLQENIPPSSGESIFITSKSIYVLSNMFKAMSKTNKEFAFTLIRNLLNIFSCTATPDDKQLECQTRFNTLDLIKSNVITEKRFYYRFFSLNSPVDEPQESIAFVQDYSTHLSLSTAREPKDSYTDFLIDNAQFILSAFPDKLKSYQLIRLSNTRRNTLLKISFDWMEAYYQQQLLKPLGEILNFIVFYRNDIGTIEQSQCSLLEKVFKLFNQDGSIASKYGVNLKLSQELLDKTQMKASLSQQPQGNAQELCGHQPNKEKRGNNIPKKQKIKLSQPSTPKNQKHSGKKNPLKTNQTSTPKKKRIEASPSQQHQASIQELDKSIADDSKDQRHDYLPKEQEIESSQQRPTSINQKSLAKSNTLEPKQRWELKQKPESEKSPKPIQGPILEQTTKPKQGTNQSSSKKGSGKLTYSQAVKEGINANLKPKSQPTSTNTPLQNNRRLSEVQSECVELANGSNLQERLHFWFGYSCSLYRINSATMDSLYSTTYFYYIALRFFIDEQMAVTLSDRLSDKNIQCFTHNLLNLKDVIPENQTSLSAGLYKERDFTELDIMMQTKRRLSQPNYNTSDFALFPEENMQTYQFCDLYKRITSTYAKHPITDLAQCIGKLHGYISSLHPSRLDLQKHQVAFQDKIIEHSLRLRSILRPQVLFNHSLTTHIIASLAKAYTNRNSLFEIIEDILDYLDTLSSILDKDMDSLGLQEQKKKSDIKIEFDCYNPKIRQYCENIKCTFDKKTTIEKSSQRVLI